MNPKRTWIKKKLEKTQKQLNEIKEHFCAIQNETKEIKKEINGVKETV
jgi:predicted  nucleic acid-binding Zn-ribbon protein